MRNLWIFLNRYNAFFFFIIFFTVGVILTIKNNAYQRSITVNSTNEVVGEVYQNLNVLKKYLNLGPVNDSLSAENAKLKTELLSLQNIDSAKAVTVTDTANKPVYTYLSARVIKNSITLRNNVITINKGRADGIAPDMAVISPGQGVVGFVLDVSEHLATIRSLLHKDAKISVTLKKSNALGILVWGVGNSDFSKAFVKEIPNHFKVSLKDTIVTSGFSRFPAGIPVGIVTNTAVPTGDNFMSVEVKLFNDFSTLQYVYVVSYKYAAEQKELEAKLPNE
ncbi:rod shape-determining protein MreC [Pedobacter nyackensis]|uniref:Cell shape-determining protein MreC n=1 Tax=Pedobacter nyackensis TaxID=475255 RepID=A0A1W2ETW6_9SPHI|nr:rod shape-determining protein MreC [Pedobacter nyackensis]SMD13160.1 rod shape-determining protein MreC [Pedobacter nyackensis]